MTMMSDLSRDLVEEILSRVPITSVPAVRSTCKHWNSLFKDPSFTKKHCRKEAKEIQVIMVFDSWASLISINLHGVHNQKDGLVEPPIKQIGKLNQPEISYVFHSNGLLLYVTENNNNRLVVCNPYTGQTRLIKPRNTIHRLERYGIGYDNNNNYKILIFPYHDYPIRQEIKYEIYDFNSDSLRAFSFSLDRPIWRPCEDLSLKGNIYFVAEEQMGKLEGDNILLCFDFTKERFGPLLTLPFRSNGFDSVLLSAVREEQLAVLLKRWDAYEMKIWITTKIEPNAVSWINFLKFDMIQFSRRYHNLNGSFFVDEKKKVAVICERDILKETNYKAYIMGEDGYSREVNILGESERSPRMCSYVPSSVKIQQSLNSSGKRKERDY
ncbi:putative F-box protein [Cardamine amara subsp. amara]|uniref:F-box protein n=1 Tax=Cardamine amara subsp. amara TaxID=228776 RepID=A0ABD1C567_CARAN